MNGASTAALVGAVSDRLAAAERRLNEAWWDLALTSSAPAQEEKSAAELALRDVLADPEAFSALGAARSSPPGDPLLARQVERLYLAALPEQVPRDLRREIVELSTGVEARFNAFRGHAGGAEVSDNEIDEVLRHSEDSAERRAYWEASKEVGAEVASDVRRLAGLRNRAARELGFGDYRALVLTIQELDPGWLAGLLAEIEQATAAPFARLKAGLDAGLARRFATEDLRPWHYGDRFFQEPPAEGGVDLDPAFAEADLEGITAATFADLGLPVGEALARSDLLPRSGKSQHAFCLHVDRAGDVRVLSNNAPSERWMSTMLHEFGHAAYDLSLEPSLPFVLRDPAHTFTTEGVAQLFGRLVHDAAWLERYTTLSGSRAQELARQAGATRRAGLLVFARWGLVMANFEMLLYADPSRPDLDERWWDLVGSLQLVRRPEGRKTPDWAAKIHLAVAPVYYHNYLLGELFASQVAQSTGPLTANPEAGRWLRQRVFEPGGRWRWDRLCQEAFAMPLSPGPWAKDLT